ncbi:MAG: LysM domain-containing protein [Betaproteobacteria bacterium]
MDRASFRNVPTRIFAVVATLALVVACADQPPKPAGTVGAPAAAAPAAPASATAAARAPDVPELTPAQAKAQAQKLALEAVDQLQNGDEGTARATLDRALALDTGNDLAKKMLDQANADAQKELGATFFRYTVQRDDSLSKLAQQFLGDRFRFYILAKYNDIANPSRLGAGQVVKIPGKAPPPAAAAPAPAPAAATADADGAARGELAALMQQGRQQQRSGNLEGAYATFSEAVTKNPGNRDAVLQRDGAKTALVRSYDREATQAFQRQNLDLAISKWDRILELDPANQKAKLERERAVDLKKRMNEKFGKPN